MRLAPVVHQASPGATLVLTGLATLVKLSLVGPAKADVRFLTNVRPTVSEDSSGTQLLRFQARTMALPVPLQQPLRDTISLIPGPGSLAVGGASCVP